MSEAWELISATEPDWTRERPGRAWGLGRGWEPGPRLMRALRSYQGARGPLAPLVRKWAALRHRLWSVASGADIPLTARIGGGLALPHPNGIVIHPEAELGPNCCLFQQVTIGVDGRGGAPVLGGHVDVGAGAKILGPVRIGDHAKIGANAVVLSDVPAGATAVGIPARVVQRGRDRADRRTGGGPERVGSRTATGETSGR